ncbi:hypothetical protein PV703_15640 [Streptomyces sp. ME01-24h]|nr:hypothetical protein [Streptomyces sp. ME01-24h]
MKFRTRTALHCMGYSGLRNEVRRLQGHLIQAGQQIHDLQGDYDAMAAELETRTSELARATAALEAEQNRVTVPQVGTRDTTALEDQATEPVNVRPLWQALGIKPVTGVEPVKPPPAVTVDPTELPLSALLLTRPRVTVSGGI